MVKKFASDIPPQEIIFPNSFWFVSIEIEGYSIEIKKYLM